MHPFHRKHAVGGVAQGHKNHGLGRIRNGDRDENGDYKDPRDEYDATIQEAMEYNRTHPISYPSITSKNALKEKENVLLESIKAFKTRTLYDNKTRLGPDKENTFQNLKRSSSTSAVDQSTTLPSSTIGAQCEPSSVSVLRVKSKSISLPQPENDEIELPITSRQNLETLTDQSLPSNDQSNKEQCDNNLVEQVEIKITCDINNSDKMCPENSTRTCNIESNEKCKDAINSSLLKKKSDESSIYDTEPVVVELNSQNSKDSNKTVPQKSKSPLSSLANKINIPSNDIDEGLEDCDEDFYDSEEDLDFVPLKLKNAIALKKLLLGSAIKSFSPQWMGQSFILSTNPKFRYGFVQNKGGACGVLATVQAFLLKSLLFNPLTATSEVDPLRPTRQEVRKALVHAIAEVLWRAGDCRQAVLVRSNQESHIEECLVYRCDGLTDSLLWRRFYKEKDLQEAVESHLDQFVSPLGKGCLRLILSAILSSGIQSVLGDMDDETAPLIGSSGTCSLELVNLLLTGHAVSNVFDNNLQLDSCLLRGISKRSEIGFLSIFEHFNSCQVGSNLKTPRYPIWLVNCENHFSVVFSSCKQLVSDWRAERQFHLYHYDGLIGQAEDTVLTIDTTGFSASENTKKDNVPPLELCIKTKWKDAVVHWSSNSS